MAGHFPRRSPVESTLPGVDVVTPVAEDLLPPGARVGRYRIVCEIGRGGMGVVYRAHDDRRSEGVALKVLGPRFRGDPAILGRFLRESRIAASLRHPNVVAVHEAGEADDHAYLAMELIEGDDLHARLARGPLEPSAAVDILRQVASALDAAHAAGLVHRDVKPANVLLSGPRAYLTDFGLTKRVDSRTSLTRAGQVVGTTDYLAPEQIDGRRVDGLADVYALTCVLYACLSGEPPFVRDSDAAVMFAHLQAPPPSIAARRADVPAAMDDVIARGMAKEPAARHPSCSALMEGARAVLASPEAAPGTRRPHGVLVAVGPASRPLVRAGLGAAGVTMRELPAGASAAEAARRDPPAVLVLDATADGASALEALRGLAAGTGAVRTIALVPRGADALAGELAAAGAYRVLTVPFSAVQLVVAVREGLEGAHV